MRRIIWCSAALFLCGCSYPTSTIEQGTEAGHIQFVGAPGVVARIDGQDRGVIGSSSWLVVDVEPGKHLVEEKQDGKILLQREYEIGAGSKVEIGEQNETRKP